ncbi:cold-shock protein, partial [Altererythrobacter salegens]|nr:cold-shock protein [Croceibacterium salegens]
MGYDRGRRGKGRDKRDGFGEEGFDPFMDNGPPSYGGGERWGGGNDRFGGDRDDRGGGGFGGP